MSDACEIVKAEYTFPFKLHAYQDDLIRETVRYDCSLNRSEVGYGKSAMALGAALYFALERGAEQIIIICPPILIDQWVEFIEEIPEIDSVCAYRGTPAQRRKMDMEESVLVMSYNIFRAKADWKRVEKIGKKRKLVVIADELSCKSLKSLTYRKMKMLIYRRIRVRIADPAKHFLVALNATPISSPLHVYNWSALLAPGVYDSKSQFDRLHVRKQDNWGNVTEWKNETLLQKNIDVFSFEPSIKLKLPPITYSKVPMALSDKHKKAYRDLVNAELYAFDEEIRALALQSMFSTLQRACILPSMLGLDEESPVVTYLLGLLDQIDENDQLLIFTRHTLVTEYIAERLPNCATIYGGTKDKAKVLADSKSGKIREIVANIDSGGHGLNLQHFKYIAWAEFPFRGDKWTQGVGRMWRMGQTKHCHVFAPYLKGTIQERLYHRLLKNDDDICRVLTTKRAIRSFLQ